MKRVLVFLPMLLAGCACDSPCGVYNALCTWLKSLFVCAGVLMVMVVGGCSAVSSEQFAQALDIADKAVEVAQEGNVAGTVDINLDGRAGFGEDWYWYIGNNKSHARLNLQFKFDEEQNGDANTTTTQPTVVIDGL